MTKADGQEKLINFATTVIQVNEHNEKFEKGEIPFALKLNSRAIFSVEQKRSTMNGLVLMDSDSGVNSVTTKAESEIPPSLQAPPSLDYRKLGYIAEIVDQGKKKC